MNSDPRPNSESSRARFRVLTVSSNKGGVGKTTFACNLAIYLRALREDLPVLLLTLDDQPMPDRMFAIDEQPRSATILTGFRRGNLERVIRLGQYGVHYVPSSAQVGQLKLDITSQSQLCDVLERTNWRGLVIIDTKSDFEVLTQNAIAASDLSIVLVSDHASLLESRRVFELFDEWGRPHQRARILLSLVDLRIKFRGNERTDILAVLLGEIRRKGYPLFETFLSRSPAIEALYTNPDNRMYAILHRAPNSLIHRQMHRLAQDVLDALDDMTPSARPVNREIEERKSVAAQVQPPGPLTGARVRDRRREVRWSYDAQVAVFRAGGPTIFPVRALDLSCEGMGIEPSDLLEGGERVHIALQQPSGEPPLLLWALVVSDAADAQGLAFEAGASHDRSRLEQLRPPSSGAH